MSTYITGDVHGQYDLHKLSTRAWPEQKGLSRDDYLIVCGDMGVVWDGGKSDRYLQDWFADKPFTTLFVDGNHENHCLLNSMPAEYWNSGKVHRLRDNLLHLMRGYVFNIHGCKVFAMGGARSHDMIFRTAGVSWWPEELPSEFEYDRAINSLDDNNWKVDLVVTHCTADSIQKEMASWYEHDKLTNFFEIVVKNRVDYKHWYFGHYHDDLDVDPKHHCLYQRIIEVL